MVVANVVCKSEGVGCRTAPAIVDLRADDVETFACPNFERVVIKGVVKGWGECLCGESNDWRTSAQNSS